MSIFKPCDILLPDVDDFTAWSVVACDQFTSEPEYWDEVDRIVGSKPSTLRMILPEAELRRKNAQEESVRINETMRAYLENGVFKTLPNSYIYIERTLSDGTIRQGIIGAFDLEAYDWKKGTATPIRATEFTVEDRLPVRVKVREKAPIELPHIMIFVDDPSNFLFDAVKKGEKLYDFTLMQHGGSIAGWQIKDNAAIENAVSVLSSSDELIKKYGTDSNPIIFAMGDGNHSIAAAKLYWEQVKATVPEAERETHPARYALAEVVNIHSDAITFEPIHRVVFETDSKDFIPSFEKAFADKIGEGKKITLISGNERRELELAGMTIGELIGACENFCKAYIAEHGGRIDYIHGDEECISMSSRENCAGILLPKMEKGDLFTSVIKSGPFPKKSFSIGHGPDKRYYLEARKIR